MTAQWSDCKEYFEGDTSPWTTGYYSADDKNQDWYQEDLARCQTIGNVPAENTLLNNGEPSVIHGKIVFDPTP